MKRRSSRVELPILVLPRGARGALPSSPNPSIQNGLTIHASSEPGPRSAPRPDPKKRGEAAEAAFLARATHLGFSVLHPWGDSNRYDAAVDLGRMILRVQVKSAASLRKGGYTIRATGGDGHIYTVAEIDFIAGYIFPENIWYIIPVEAVQSRGMIEFRPHSRRQVKPIYERYREAWCLLDCPRKKRGRKDIPALCRSREVGVQCEVCPLKRS